jgi:hypothetical protein
MNGFSIWHWLIVLLIIVMLIGVRRIAPIPPVFTLLFSAQPAKNRREAEYIDDAPPRKHSLWVWLAALAVLCGLGLFALCLK